MNIKKNHNSVIFTDLDGTLLDHFTYQSDAALAMLEQLKSQHIPIIPNTSKTCEEVLQIRDELQLDGPFIIENGAAVYIPVDHFAVQPKGTRRDKGFWVKSFCQTRDYWLALLAQSASQYRPDFIGFNDLSVIQLAELTGLSQAQAAKAKNRQYGEPLQWTGEPARQSAFIEHLHNLGAHVLKGGRFLHISGQCNKGEAQLWLAAQYQLNRPAKKSVSIALGDSDNDIAMLEAADIALQVRSPVHGFVNLKRQTGIYRSTKFGPAGWAECLQAILFS